MKVLFNIELKLTYQHIQQFKKMQQQEICNILKQILPELQNKIRCELQAEYEQKLKQLQKSYEQEIQMLLNHENQLKIELEKALSNLNMSRNQQQDRDKEELYRRIGVLQAQRKNWVKLQLQYQKSIKQMSQLLVNVEVDRTLENTSTISNSVVNYTGAEYNSIKGVHPPPKSSIVLQNNSKPFKKQKQRSRKQSAQAQKSQMAIQQSKISQISQNSLYRYINSKPTNQNKYEHNININIKNQQYESNCIQTQKQKMKRNEETNKQHYHSVLSPPKIEDKSNVGNLDKSGQGKRIFWDQNKKKQLLSLIKLN